MKKKPEEWMQMFNDHTLAEGDYWIKLKDGSIIVDHYSSMPNICAFYSHTEDIDIIVDKVPDYEFWQGFNEEHDQMHYTIVGLKSELNSALEIIAKDGKHDRWLEKNYPSQYKQETNM